MYPDAAWYRVVVQKTLHPSVPMYVIINPGNGIGAAQDPAYTPYLARFRAAGIRILGYVGTGYGRRTAANVAVECALYESWYQVDGIFFDEYQNGWMPPAVPGVLIGNPGTSATGPIPLITYESAGMPPAGFSGNYIAHTVPVLPNVLPQADFLYVTDDPATYQVLPSYFPALTAAVDSSAHAPVPPPGASLMLTTPDGKTYSWQISSV